MNTVAFHTLGCKLNFADTHRLALAFEAQNFSVVDDGQPADVTIINSCSVTDEADRKCRQLVRRSLKANPETFVIVTGCYAQLQPGAISGIPGVDLVVGMKDKFRILDVVSSFDKVPHTQVEVSCIDDALRFEPSYSAARTRTVLKIQDGCDYSCSFCTIPLARGRSRSNPIDSVLADVRDLASQGVKELVLSGVNLGLFGGDKGESLFDLLTQIDATTDIRRIRISSIEPNLLTDELIDLIGVSDKIVPHFHLPLQSGDDHVLGAMRRRYRRSDYSERVSKILDACPNACIGADVIVGFPAENEERFQTTFDFIADLPLAYLHVFTYSPRANTASQRAIEEGAWGLPDRKIRSRRNGILRGLSASKRRTFYESQIGRTLPVLWEGKLVENAGVGAPGRAEMFGFTDNYVKLRRPYSESLLREFQNVELVAVDESDSILAVRVVATGL